jgi:hypothetical protein
MIFGSWNLFISSLGVLLSTNWVLYSNQLDVGQETEESAEDKDIWAQLVAGWLGFVVKIKSLRSRHRSAYRLLIKLSCV